MPTATFNCSTSWSTCCTNERCKRASGAIDKGVCSAIAMGFSMPTGHELQVVAGCWCPRAAAWRHAAWAGQAVQEAGTASSRASRINSWEQLAHRVALPMPGH